MHLIWLQGKGEFHEVIVIFEEENYTWNQIISSSPTKFFFRHARDIYQLVV